MIKQKMTFLLLLGFSVMSINPLLSAAVETSSVNQKKAAQDSAAKPRVGVPFPEVRSSDSSDSGSRQVQAQKQAAEPEAVKKKIDADYKIQPSDRLNVKIYPEDDYVKGGTMQVSSEGSITIPLVGKVTVGGKTPVQAEKDLAKLIDADYLVNPEVVIEIMEYASKSINKKMVIALGQIRKPGTYEVPPEKEKITLLELISMAGGFTEIANIKKIKIIHKRGGKKEVTTANGEAIISGSSPDIELEAGDVVNVAESVF